ncbi:RNA polymerase subunit sigma-70 [Planctomycetaceae bacterium SCGC AG-212-F19]|nr:RNA polymerase subunit sigma-70 [Planctomycetaceae bacterium SCGC AG-212-F19]
MAEAPVTRASLLVRLRDPQDHDAWQQFFRVYASVVYGFARRRGLQDADAADLMQDVLRRVALAAGKLDYDPRKGTFRSWLFTVTRNRLFDFLNSRQRQVAGAGGSDGQRRLDEQPATPDPADGAGSWDQEYHQGVLRWAMERVRGEFQENTWQAFRQTAVEGKNPKEVAGSLKMSPGAVYVAKSRVLARLKTEVRQWQDD